MRVPRLHVDEPLTEGAGIEFPPATARYLSRVLRLAPGAALVVFDGRGGEHEAIVEALDARRASARIGARREVERESALEMRLVQGISRGERMDWSIQKAVELGVRVIAPVTTRRSVVRLDAARARARTAHWRGVATAACQQSGRTRLPAVDSPVGLDEWLATSVPASMRIVLDPGAERALSALAPPAGGIDLLIGPEGGLGADEIAAAGARGFVQVNLGPRTLRTETATLAALTALQLLWGDLR